MHHRITQTLSRALGVVLAAGLAVGARAGTVVILEGSDTNAKTNTGIHQIADIAVANYTAKGYTIKRLPNTMGAVARADAVMALNMAGVNAFFFAGHGTTGTARLVLDYPSGGAAAKALTPADLAGAYGGIKQVEFQACQQNQPGWSAKFPMANLDAWTGSITVDQAKNDAKNGSPGRIPVKTPPTTTGTSAAKTGMDARIAQQVAMMPDAQDAGPGYMCGDWTQLGFQLDPVFGAALGTKTFNLRTQNGSDFLDLRGLTISNGIVVDDVNGAYPTAAFTLTFDWDAFDLAMQNIDVLPSLFASGQARIENNFTSMPDPMLYQAAIGVYFGYGAIPAPGAATLMALAGFAATRRRRPALV